MELETGRLLLRQWKDSDLPVFAALNSDPAVMKYFPILLSREASDAMAEKCRSLISERGWGFWATELKENNKFIGFVGLHEPKDTFPFAPSVEIGWRLLGNYWGKGYATEAATQALQFSFDTLDLHEVVSFTPASNSRSRSVMDRIGMINTCQNFKHPDLPKNHSLSEHVLYKITKNQWQKSGL
ncbi:MAG: GNAT family N-acetyltransferase [Gammaproteobacteria bacterium]|nr:GNAT family N-acetyltransferase [Gammaproteobacteria bacterium]